MDAFESQSPRGAQIDPQVAGNDSAWPEPGGTVPELVRRITWQIPVRNSTWACTPPRWPPTPTKTQQYLEGRRRSPQAFSIGVPRETSRTHAFRKECFETDFPRGLGAPRVPRKASWGSPGSAVPAVGPIHKPSTLACRIGPSFKFSKTISTPR